VASFSANEIVSCQGEIQRSDTRSGECMEQPACSWLAHSCGARVHHVWVIEVVVRVNVCLIQHGAGCAGDAGPVDDNLRSQKLVKVRVHDSERDLLSFPAATEADPLRPARVLLASSDPR
jgi:hypothetical protein